MKLTNKILIGLSISLSAIIIIFSIFSGDLAKYLILKYGPYYTGRKITVENVKLNIFKGKTSLEKFTIYEKDQKNLFFSIDKLDLDIDLVKLFDKKIKIEGLGLENPKVNIKKDGDVYNFVDIIESIKNKSSKKEEKTDKKNSFVLSEFQLKNLNFEYKDDKMDDKFKIKIDDFNMPQLEIDKDINFSFSMVSKGNLELQTKVQIRDKNINIENKKFFINFDTMLPFIKTMMSVSSFHGTFGGESKINIDIAKGGVAISGKSQYKNIEIVSLDNESMIKLGQVDLDVENISTTEEKLFINSLKIQKPEINFEIYEKGFNLLKLLKGESKPLVFTDYKLNQFILEKGSFNFTDSSKKEKFKYNLYNIALATSPIAKDIQGFTLNGALNLNNESSTLETKINFKNSSFNDIGFDISAKSIKLEDFTHYIKDSINISSLKGYYSGNLSGNYKLKNKTPYINIKGDSQLDSFVLIDKRKSAEILNLKSLKIDIDEISLPENRFIINNVAVDKLKLYGYIAKDGNTMELLFPINKKQEKEKKKPMTFLLKNFSFKNGNIKFSDDTFEKPFTYILDIPNGNAKNISSKKNNNSIYNINLITNKTGKVNITGNATVGNEFETDTKFQISNFNFGDFKPFSEKYSDFITNSGVLNYEGTFTLKNRKIKSENNARILNIDIGEKEKVLPLGISINFVMSIIENDLGEVTIILPVEGDMDNPKFSYKKTVLIALKNMFVNIATAPFKFMKTDDGDNMDSLQELDVELLNKALPEISVKKLEKIAKILKKKKLLQFEFVQVLDRETEYEMLVMKNIKTKFYMAKNSLVELKDSDYVEIENIADSDPSLVAYINEKVDNFKGSNELNLLKKSEMVLGKENMENEFETLISNRNIFILEKLKEFGVEDFSRAKVRFAKNEELGDVINPHYIVKISSVENKE